MEFCLFCGGDASEPGHLRACDGRQGAREAEAEALPPFAPFEHARTSDPETSHAAAWSVTDATEVQRRVLDLYRSRGDLGLTDEELLAAYAAAYPSVGRSLESRASPRKRRSDLARVGLVFDSGERRALSSGRRGVVWKLRAALVGQTA